MYIPTKRQRAPLDQQLCPVETCEGFGKPLGQGWCKTCVASIDPEKRKKGSSSRSPIFKLHGNISRSKIESPIAWLVDACVAIQLIPAEFVKKFDGDPAKVLANWDDCAKRTKEDRYKTGGRITDPEFWPAMLRQTKKNLCPASSQVFTDFGSEFFFPGFLCSMLGTFKEVVGIEVDSEVFDKSVELAQCLMARAKRERKFMSAIELHLGNFLLHDGIISVMQRTTIAYTNNIIFGTETNVALIDLWRRHLPANAAMVLFDETAVLSSACERSSRSQSNIDWAFKHDTIKTSVSWQPLHACDVHLWEVSPKPNTAAISPDSATPRCSLLQTSKAKYFLTETFQAGTKVFVAAEQDVGTVVSFNRHSKQYSVKFIDDCNMSRIESVNQKDAFKFFSRDRVGWYPPLAIPLNASVKCVGMDGITVWGHVNGVAVNYINHPLYYDVWCNDFTEFFSQEYVSESNPSKVLQHTAQPPASSPPPAAVGLEAAAVAQNADQLPASSPPPAAVGLEDAAVAQNADQAPALSPPPAAVGLEDAAVAQNADQLPAPSPPPAAVGLEDAAVAQNVVHVSDSSTPPAAVFSPNTRRFQQTNLLANSRSALASENDVEISTICVAVSDAQAQEFGDCPVCQETFRFQDRVRFQRCLHKFHDDCLTKHYSINGHNCPVCKVSMVEGSQEPGRRLHTPVALTDHERASVNEARLRIVMDGGLLPRLPVHEQARLQETRRQILESQGLLEGMGTSPFDIFHQERMQRLGMNAFLLPILNSSDDIVSPVRRRQEVAESRRLFEEQNAATQNVVSLLPPPTDSYPAGFLSFIGSRAQNVVNEMNSASSVVPNLASASHEQELQSIFDLNSPDRVTNRYDSTDAAVGHQPELPIIPTGIGRGRGRGRGVGHGVGRGRGSSRGRGRGGAVMTLQEPEVRVLLSPTAAQSNSTNAYPFSSFLTPQANRQALDYSQISAGGSCSDAGASSSSSSDSVHEHLAPRRRAPKFLPQPVETTAILYQLCTECPYTHSRNGQKAIWIHHLKELKKKGLCVDIPLSGRGGSGGSFKTLVKWCNEICKKRVAFRAKERKQSGLATIEPPTVLDTIAGMWNDYKIATDVQSRQSAAQASIIREAATSTNASLMARAARIQAQRDSAHRARPPADPNDPYAPRGEEDQQSQQPPQTPQTPQIPSAAIPNRSTNAHEVRELLRRSASGVSQGEIAQIVSNISQQIVSITRTEPPQTPQPQPQPQPSQPATRGVRERLNELKELYEDGEITAEELTVARRDILRLS
jgi:hypothetical protein